MEVSNTKEMLLKHLRNRYLYSVAYHPKFIISMITEDYFYLSPEYNDKENALILHFDDKTIIYYFTFVTKENGYYWLKNIL